MRPDSVFENCKQVDRRCILTDVNPSAAVVEVIEHLLKRFSDLKVSRSTVYNFICNGTPSIAT